MNIDDFLNEQTKNEKIVSEQEKDPAGDTSSDQQNDPGKDLSQYSGLITEIKMIRALLDEKKFEEAYSNYIQAKEKFAELSRKQLQEQNIIYNELNEINKMMVVGLNKLKQDTTKKVEVIRQLIVKAYDHKNNNMLDKANQLYEQIIELFNSLQDVLPQEKLKLENEISSLHVSLASKSNLVANADFQTKFNTLNNMLNFAFENIRNGDLEKAVQLYQRINNMYGELPKGFLYEKAVLYQKILKLFNDVRHTQDKQILKATEGFVAPVDNQEEKNMGGVE